MKLFLVRHGETEGNTQHLMQGGGSDAPLTKKGQAQAKWIGHALSGVPFDSVFVSPKDRARHTAQAIYDESFYDLPSYQIEEALNEMHFGKYEAQPIEVFIQQHQFEIFESEKEAHAVGCETFEDVTHRMVTFTKQIAETSKDNVLFVSHGMTLMCLMDVLFKAEGVAMPQEVLHNASLSVFDIQKEKGTVHHLLFNRYDDE